MDLDYFEHPQRFPKNSHGPFYSLGDITSDGTWCGRCLSCHIPEEQAPTLLAPLTGVNSDTYFVRQPETDEEIEQACCAIEVCCVDALRYGGRDPKILARLEKAGNCDYAVNEGHPTMSPTPKLDPTGPQVNTSRKWWNLWT